MKNLSVTSQNFDPTLEEKKETTSHQPSSNIWKKLRGGFFVVFGYLLSPLCWWNDLLFNLPIAYFFGYVCSFLSE
ncbi:MAG: hypothetical protein ACKO2Z_21975, partial [Sphaerospermopsis kisseleviana]